FGTVPAAGGDAIPASRQRTKGRTLEVVCPMCETPGFVPKKAAGKNVRCANPECLVPVYTAPAAEEEAETTEAVAKPTDKKLLIYGVLVGVGLIGAGVAWFVANQEPVQHGPIPQKTYQMVGDDPDDSKSTPETAKTAKVVKDNPYRKLRQQALADMHEQSFTPEAEGNRSMAACRRLVADAYARSDDFENSAKQLELLQDKLQTSTEYFEIPLRLSTSRRMMVANDTAGAQSELDEALKLVAGLPKIGQDRLDVVIDLAVALVEMGQTPQARKILEAHEDRSMDAQLAAYAAILREHEYADLQRKRWSRPLFHWHGPMHKAVTVALVARGHGSAKSWAENSRSVATKIECFLALVETTILVSDTMPDSEIDQIAGSLPPEGRALLHARVAFRSWSRVETVKRHLDLAAAALTQVKPLQSLQRTDSARLIVDAKIPESTSIEMAVRAAVEIGRLQYFLQQKEVAWKTFESALILAASMAPASNVAFALRQVSNTAKADLEAFVKAAMNLTTDQDAQVMARRYLEQCSLIANSSHSRYLLEGHVLLHAAILGFHTEVMGILERDRYFLTNIPIAWARVFEKVQRKDYMERIERDFKIPRREMTDFEAVEFAALGTSRLQFENAKKLLNQGKPEIANLRRMWLDDVICGLCDESDLQGQPVAWRDAFSLIKTTAARKSADDLWREQAFNLLAMRAARYGSGESFLRYLSGQKLPATQAVAALHGLIVGLNIVERREAAQLDAPSTKADPKKSKETPAVGVVPVGSE
ncbi:MAG: hypothetical protein O3A00_27675, partial [Planctomycetota bacterium]|nr:hypothetical protein [Planctomycetota bacterium]